MNTENKAQEQDPLEMPVGDTNTDFPLLKPGKIYRVTIRAMEEVDVKKDGAPPGAKNLLISLATSKDELSVDDKPLHSGFPLRKYIPIYASGERKMEDVKRDLATFNKAVLGPVKGKGVAFAAYRTNPELFIDKLVDVKVGISTDKTGQFGDSNSVKFVIPNA